jgi:hypothetical protein
MAVRANYGTGIIPTLFGAELFVMDEPLNTLQTTRPLGWATHWGMMHAGKIMMRTDSGMNFSPNMYEEFFRPYDQRLLNELGGGAVHFCGRGSHYIASMCSMDRMYAIQLSQPHLNEMETIIRIAARLGRARSPLRAGESRTTAGKLQRSFQRPKSRVQPLDSEPEFSRKLAEKWP